MRDGTLRPALEALADMVWGPFDGSSPVELVWGHAPEQGRVCSRYLVLPDFVRARLLLPEAPPHVTATVAQSFNGLRRRPVRALRAATAAAMRADVVRSIFTRQLSVAVDDRIPTTDEAGWLIERHLQNTLDERDLLMSVSVRPVRPNYKPMLQLFGPSGTPIGYGKLGCTQSAASRVLTEARALQMLRGRNLRAVRVPALLHNGAWRGREVCVVKPLPQSARHYKDFEQLPPYACTTAIAEATDVYVQDLGASTYWADTRNRLNEAGGDAESDQVLGYTRALFHQLQEDAGRIPLRFGFWHGDWVPWNVAWSGPHLWVWDWEHSHADVPVGFDILHWRLQVALVRRRLGMRQAVETLMTRGVQDVAGLLQVDTHHAGLISALYLLEFLLRSDELRRSGSSWPIGVSANALSAMPSTIWH